MTATSPSTTSPLERLRQCGDPRKTRNREHGGLDYVQQLGLTPHDIPAMIALLDEWLDDEPWPDDPEDMRRFAPVHAWRALAQLRATAAIAPMLAMMDTMDARQDDWYLNEFPHAFALIGAPAFAPVAEYLADSSHSEFPRICAADSLQMIARQHAALREAAVTRLTRHLDDYTTNPIILNGFLISNLIELHATESAELIERAFADRCVDESVAGDWHEVRAELGVEGTGLVPPRQRPRGGGAPALADGFRSAHAGDLAGGVSSGFKSRKAQKRKKQRAARKRGRRR